MGILLLLTLTILAVSGLATAVLELRMAGNTQYQERAFQAAEYAIEQALASPDLGTTYTLLESQGRAGLRQPARGSRITTRYVRIPDVLRRSARRHAAARRRRHRHRARGVPLRHRGDRQLGARRQRHARAGLLPASARPGRRTACARATVLPAPATARASRATIRGAPTGCRSGRSDRHEPRPGVRSSRSWPGGLRREASGVTAIELVIVSCDRRAAGRPVRARLSRPRAARQSRQRRAPRCSASPRPRRSSTCSATSTRARSTQPQPTACSPGNLRFPAASERGYYTLAVTSADANGWTATATAVSTLPQYRDTRCRTFQLDQHRRENGPELGQLGERL